MTATITALYAALDEPDADVTHVLGLLADAYMDAGDTDGHDWVRNRERFERCNDCGAMRPTRTQIPMTQYPTDADNHVGRLCYECHTAYVEHWTYMWEEYYSMVR